jgi:hypothetical protein
MTREEAKQKLALARLPLLDEEDREGLLMEWMILSDDEESLVLAPGTIPGQNEIEEIEDPALAKYDPLILQAIEGELIGVTNAYLKAQLIEMDVKVGEVEGEVEKMEACPCCGYLALENRQMYEICPVCYWLDDETEGEETVSEENEMSLVQARENFKKFGIMDESIIEFRVEEPESVYHRG